MGCLFYTQLLFLGIKLDIDVTCTWVYVNNPWLWVGNYIRLDYLEVARMLWCQVYRRSCWWIINLENRYGLHPYNLRYIMCSEHNIT